MTEQKHVLAEKINKQPWEVALSSFLSTFRLGADGIGVFALQLQFDVEDVATVAAEALTGGGDDKKCDMLWVDTTRGLAVIAQCYMSQKHRPAARSNKASDLNAAASWLLVRPLEKLPDGLKGRASELRDAIVEGKIDRLHVWFVHNVPESDNCKSELTTVAHNVKTLVEKMAPANTIAVIDDEIGSSRLAELYEYAERTFRVTDKIEFSSPHAFEVSGNNWKSLVGTITGKRLFELYEKHRIDLFSANLRDYLGSNTSDSNINNGIKMTAVQSPADFWVYNNGITALTLDYEVGKKMRGKYNIKLTGLSIVNGAQTTGSVGSLEKHPSADLLVPIRLVKTDNEKVIDNTSFDIIIAKTRCRRLTFAAPIAYKRDCDKSSFLFRTPSTTEDAVEVLEMR